jgi:pimeloyl-ACP methyl ester carboxylesterase
VDTENTSRGPLLITGGGKDHIAPPVLGQASLKKYNPVVATDFKLFPDKGHSLVIDHGWKEVASYAHGWLHDNGF